MNCPEFRDAIQRYLDGDEPVEGSSAWNEHLQACGRCRSELAAAQLLRQGLRQLPRPEVTAGVTSRLVEIVDRDQRWRRRMGWWRNAVILATAASLLAFVGYGILRNVPDKIGPVDPKNDIATNPEKKTDIAPRTEEAERALAAVAQSVQENTKTPIDILLAAANPLDKTATMPSFEQPLDPAMQAAQSLRSASRNMAETFEPVANTARQAALFFAREIPVDFQMREN